jgi:FkbM family methyltransferase
MTFLRKIRNKGRRIWDLLWTRSNENLTVLGTASPWTIKSELLPVDAVVVSGGVGKDVSFERDLAEKYGCKVFLFDPSPTGLATMSMPQNQHERMVFFPLGLAADFGTLAFSLPQNPAEGSYSVQRECLKTGAVEFQCTKLSEFAKAKKLKRIDLLKLDIEGFEYGVLEDVLESGLPITQICVEFHHFMPGIGLGETLRCIWRLRQSGYSLVSKNMCDYLFVARTSLK